MQTKHLHGLLLISLLLGCGGNRFSADNPCLSDKGAVALTFSGATSVPSMFFGNLDLAVAPPTEAGDPFLVEIHPATDGRWIGGLQVDGFDRRAARVSRTLSSLVIEDTTTGWRYAASALPGGTGVAFYLEGEVYTRVRFALAHSLKDTLFLSGFKGDKLESYVLKDSSFLALAATPSFADERDVHGIGFELHGALNDGQRRQVVMAFAPTAEGAQKIAAAYRGMTRKKLERAARDTLAQAGGFSLNTEDDPTNEVFALLSAALAKASGRISTASPRETEEGASAARALFLASRESPRIALAANTKETPARLQWGSEAYRAALMCGMGSEDSLKNASLTMLAGVAELSRDYAANLYALGDDEIADTLQRLAVAHVRYAELLTLCGDISAARGDRDAESGFRKEALRAAKNARRFFHEAAAVYHEAHRENDSTDTPTLAEYEPASKSEDVELTLPRTTSVNPPDTLGYVRTGAHYGFGWLAERPLELMRVAVDGFTWQKWTAQRFADDLKVTQTPDLDSLLTLMLQGPVPGGLTGDPGHDGELSLTVMAAAFENLAELYLGMQPNWMQHRVDILPRPPQRWGQTAARVPIGPGFLHLDYDFENSVAYVGMSGIERKLDVFFGYPLPTGGFTRTQFALSPDEPRMRISMIRDSENRVKLDVKPAG